MNEFEQREQDVRRAIAKYRIHPNFPKIEDYGGDEELLDDYFYLQTLQGGMEEEKRKLTVYGVLLIAPIAVMSFFFRDVMSLLYGLAIGSVLSAFYFMFLKGREKRRWKRFEEAKIEKYVEDVLQFQA